MIFALLIPIIILLLFGIISSAKPKPSDYFPHQTMNKHFKGDLENDEFLQIVDLIEGDRIQIKQVNRYAKVVMIYELSKDSIDLVYSLEERDHLKDNYMESMKENRKDIIINSPLEVGTNWMDTIGGKYRIIEVDSHIKTPAGEFEVLIVGYENDEFNVKEYYGKGVGLVKIVINNYLVNELVELEIMDN